MYTTSAVHKVGGECTSKEYVFGDVEFKIVEDFDDITFSSLDRHVYMIVIISGAIRIMCGDDREFCINGTGINKALVISISNNEEFTVYKITERAVFMVAKQKYTNPKIGY